jgi:hypothetical protein
MAAISEFYASPGLRLGLLLEDHPEATYDFQLVAGSDVGVPDKFGGDKQFCLATIRFPAGRSDVTAWKPVPASGSPDEWNILCTKTLGRALKRAGYPDDLKDLKALVLWRQRDAEIAAIRGGAELTVQSANTIAALPSADPMQLALDQAGVTSDEAIGGDEEPDAFADVVDDETLDQITELMDGLNPTEEKVFLAFLKKLGVTNLIYATATDAEAILGWFDA